MDDEVTFERLRFAALKESRGDIEVLKEAIALGKVDFRDLLRCAGFAWDPMKHQAWLPKAMGPRKPGLRSRIFRMIGGWYRDGNQNQKCFVQSTIM